MAFLSTNRLKTAPLALFNFYNRFISGNGVEPVPEGMAEKGYLPD
jgi:hypothetical protein